MVMIVLLVSCALIDPGVTDIALLGLAGFAVNIATTFQDVAVDGLAVDIMEEAERARASAMMFGGQSIGIASATALSGLAIARLGPAAAYLLAAAAISAITLHVLLLTERTGERLMPWSAGAVHPRNRAIHVGAWWPIVRSTVVAMSRPVSLLWLPVLLVRGFHYGMFTAITPLIGTGHVGWSEVQVTSAVGSAQLAGGVIGLTLGGWLGDRFGARRATIAMFAALMAMSAAMWFGVANWGEPAYFTAFIYAWCGLDVLITVVALPISMRLCDPRVAATQFTLYMATANFGISVAAWAFGFSTRLGGLPVMFVLVFALHLVGLMLVALVEFHRHQRAHDLDAPLAERQGPEPVII
jgi:PAT family beta-lactamase induction signal transducer AmpG